MAGARKLQAEVDRTLKQIGEHIIEFDGIWEKVISTPTPNLKEKYETDLKKEIKKLQRLRDAAKVFIAHHDIKNKKPLVDARKTIEGKMEQFKVLERETKTKAYSKEGLSLVNKRKEGGVMNEKDEERKTEVREWLEDFIKTLNTQHEEYEEKVEAAAKGGSSAANKNKKKGKSSASADNVEELQHTLDRHQWHLDRLNGIQERLDDDVLSAEQVEAVKDDIEYYINNHAEPDFQEDETIYDDLDLDSESLERGSTGEDDAGIDDDDDADNGQDAEIDVDEEAVEEAEEDKRVKTLSPNKGATKAPTPTTKAATTAPVAAAGKPTASATKPTITPTAATKATPIPASSPTSTSASTPATAATVRIVPSTPVTTAPTPAARTNATTAAIVASKATQPSVSILPTPAPLPVNNKKTVPTPAPTTPSVPTPVTVIAPAVKAMESMASIVKKSSADEQRRTAGGANTTTTSAPPSVTTVPSITPTAVTAPNVAKPPLPATNTTAAKPPVAVNTAAAAVTSVKPETSPSSATSVPSSQTVAVSSRPPLITPTIKLPSSSPSTTSIASTVTTPVVSPTTASTTSAPSTPLLSAASQLGSAAVSAAPSHASSTSTASSLASSPPAVPTPAPLSRPSSAASLNQPDDSNAFHQHHLPPQSQQPSPHIQPAPGFSPNLPSSPASLPFDQTSQSHPQSLSHPSASLLQTHSLPPSAAMSSSASSSSASLNRDRGLITDDYFYTLSLLDTSLKSLPVPDDTDRPKQYTPRNPHRTPPFFPAAPAPIFDDPALFEKLSVDTLFFIFYFQQGTPHQYLAARELKKQSWRYHKNFLTWFQRHDDPKLTSDEYEQGTYVYFDYESGWCQRIKADFTFEYRHLEDELNVPLASTL